MADIKVKTIETEHELRLQFQWGDIVFDEPEDRTWFIFTWSDDFLDTVAQFVQRMINQRDGTTTSTISKEAQRAAEHYASVIKKRVEEIYDLEDVWQDFCNLEADRLNLNKGCAKGVPPR